MRKIIWSEVAENDFTDNIDYLLKEWSVKDAEEFINKVDKIVFSLKQNRINYNYQVLKIFDSALFASR